MTLFNFGAIRCASGNAIHISPEVIEFGTVGIQWIRNLRSQLIERSRGLNYFRKPNER